MVIAMAFTAALGGIVGYWVTDRDNPVAVLSRTLLTPIVNPGGALQIERQVYRQRQCSTTVERVITDAGNIRYVLPNETLSIYGTLGDDHFVTSVPIPSEASVGPAVYTSTVRYVCNPIHLIWPIVFQGSPIQFEIR